jgi:PAS domain S-box-containing protein
MGIADERKITLTKSLVNDFDTLADQMRAQLFELEARANTQTRDLQTVTEVSRQVSTILNLQELLPRVVELTKESFLLYHAHIYLLDEERGILKLAAGSGDAGRLMVARGHAIDANHPHSIVARAAREHQPVIANNVTIAEDFLPNPLLPDTRSELAVPLMVGETLVGILDVQADEFDRFSTDDAQVMSTLASQVAVAVQNAQTFQDVKEAEARIQLYVDLVNSNPIGMYVYRLEQPYDPRSLRLMAANEASYAATGVRPEEIVGKLMPEAFPGLFETQIPEIYTNIIRTGEAVELGEIRYGDARVAESIFLVRAFPLPEYSVGVSFENITARKQTEELILRRANEFEAIAQVSVEATTTLDVHELLQNVSELVKQRFNLYHAHIYLVDETGQKLILRGGAGEVGQKMLALGRSISMTHTHSLVARAAREAKGIISNDVTIEPDFLPNPLLPNTRSEMAVPMMIGGRVIGVLDVQSDIINRFDDEDVRVKTTLAAQVAVAVQNAALFAETQFRLRDLQVTSTIAEYLRNSDDIETTLENVLSVIIEALGADNAVMSNYDPETDHWHGFIGAGEQMNSSIARQFVDPGMRYPHGIEVVEKGLVVAVDNVRAYPGFPMDIADMVGIKSVLALPVYAGTRVGGVIFVNYNRLPHHFTQAEISLASGIASQISVSIERKLSNEALAKSERRYRDIAESLPGAIFQISVLPDGWKMDYISSGIERISGIPADTIMKDIQALVSAFHPDDVPVFSAAGLKAVEERSPWAAEGRLIRPDGEIRWWQSNSVPSFSDDGVTIFNGVLLDITSRKQAELEVQRNERFLRTVLNATPDWLFIKNRDYRFTLVNESFAKALGKSVDEIIGKDDIELGFPPELVFGKPEEGIAGFRADDARVFAGEIHHIPRDIATDADGKTVILDTTKIPLRDNEGEIYGILGFAHDITARIRDQEAIENARQRAEILAAMTTALSQASDEDEILAAVAILAETYGVSMSTLVYVNETDETEIVAARSGNGEKLSLSVFPATRLPVAELPVVRLTAESLDTNLIMSNIPEEAGSDEALMKYAATVNVNAVISLPLRTAGGLQGVLTFNWHEPQEFSSELIDILEAIRPSAASTLATRRAYLLQEQARRESESRAAELAAVAEVGAQITASLDLQNLLQQVADLVKERFNLYHAHVYLLEDTGQHLILSAGAGEAGRIMKQKGHRIGINVQNSIVARAARSREGVIINDVLQYEGYLPNPFLPQTKSEMAIPMIVANQLVGVLDVQSEILNRFTDQDLQVKSALAGQIAIAVQNARSFREMERQAEREREIAERLREVDRLKSQFLANMSHELRTPLNSIIGYAEVLLDGVDGELEEEAIEDVTAIYDSGRHLLSIINEILDLAKIEAGQMHLDRRRVELNEFVGEIVRNGQILLKNKPVTLTLQQESSVPAVYADPVRLKQIIWNLVSNAVKFTEQGSVTVCYGRADDENVYVKVVDTGIGMSEEGQRVIFERFSQVDGSSTRRAGGTGLGLTITQQLVHMHGGEIMVESVLGKGSTFSFTMPAYQEEKVAQGK